MHGDATSLTNGLDSDHRSQVAFHLEAKFLKRPLDHHGPTIHHIASHDDHANDSHFTFIISTSQFQHIHYGMNTSDDMVHNTNNITNHMDTDSTYLICTFAATRACGFPAVGTVTTIHITTTVGYDPSREAHTTTTTTTATHAGTAPAIFCLHARLPQSAQVPSNMKNTLLTYPI